MYVVPVAWLRHFADEFGPDSPVLSGALAASGLSTAAASDRGTPIPCRKFALLVETAADLAGDPVLGMRLGATYDLRASGLVAYVSISAATLREGMRNASRYGALNDTSAWYELREGGGRGRFRIDSHSPWIQGSAQAAEFKAAMILAACRRWVGTDFRPLEMRFAHARAEGDGSLRAAIEGWYGAPVRFGCGSSELVFSSAQLSLTTSAADPFLLDLLRGHAEEALARQGEAGEGLRARVWRLICKDLPKGVPTARSISSDLGMSERTFARRLREDGTSFRALTDEVRREMARSYLADPSLTLAQVAYLLGYADQSAFSNSFRRWTGQSPRRFRAQGADEVSLPA